MAFSIERSRGNVSDVKQNIESKKSELSKLEEQKQSLLDAGIEVQDSDLDENVQQSLMGQIDAAIEANSEKASELSEEMNDDVSIIEDMKQDVQGSLESNKRQQSSIEQKKALLDRFGIGSSLDAALGELADNQGDLNDLMGSLVETGKELDDLARKFSVI